VRAKQGRAGRGHPEAPRAPHLWGEPAQRQRGLPGGFTHVPRPARSSAAPGECVKGPASRCARGVPGVCARPRRKRGIAAGTGMKMPRRSRVRRGNAKYGGSRQSLSRELTLCDRSRLSAWASVKTVLPGRARRVHERKSAPVVVTGLLSAHASTLIRWRTSSTAHGYSSQRWMWAPRPLVGGTERRAGLGVRSRGG